LFETKGLVISAPEYDQEMRAYPLLALATIIFALVVIVFVAVLIAAKALLVFGLIVALVVALIWALTRRTPSR
jgi:hypothetical protein